jgi:uncharacterized protein involved in response to NO
MITLNEPTSQSGFALFNLGFRIFFASAGILAFAAIAIWTGILQFGWQPLAQSSPETLTGMQWHAHEMIYGYGLAVISGFLLTAVRNWTSLTTPSGLHLAGIFVCWLAARLMPFLSLQNNLLFMAILDLLFFSWVIISITVPIIRAKQKRQIAIVFCTLLLFGSHLLFYLGMFGLVENGMSSGLYSGFYLVIGMILILGGRVIPFFIERGVGHSVTLRKSLWIDVPSLLVFVIFWLVECFTTQPLVSASLAILLCLLHGLRLAGWWVGELWRKPLLWVLWVGYASIVVGFALKAASYFYGLSPYLAVHALGYGGIGLITAGMMCRVSLGHTGRNIQQPPAVVTVIFYALLAGVIIRVGGPWLLPAHYSAWISFSGLLWLLAFGLFCWRYVPMLARPRADGQAG